MSRMDESVNDHARAAYARKYDTPLRIVNTSYRNLFRQANRYVVLFDKCRVHFKDTGAVIVR